MTTFGKYQVIERIGEGGFGRIFKGWDPGLKRFVAIKTCSFQTADLRERFTREAEIAANLRHPNIVTVYDFGVQDGEPYLVQEFLSGEDLDEKIRRRDPIDLATRLEYLAGAARGLQFAHRSGVVHRDVKPGNVRVEDDGTVRLLDFGIAKLMAAEKQLTQVGMSMGTIGYLSPEQLRGEEIDHRADIFSFGVLAYELVTYRKPFEGESITNIFYRIANEAPPPLAEIAPECPPRLVACIDHCLRKLPDERPADLGEVITELEAIIASLRGQAGVAPASALAETAVAPTAVTATGILPAGVAGGADEFALAATGARTTAGAAGGTAPAAAPAGAAAPARPVERLAATGGQRRRSRVPAYVGLGTAALAVALFGIFNVARWGQGSPAEERQTPLPVTQQPAPAPPPVPGDENATAADASPAAGIAGAAGNVATRAASQDGGAANAGSRETTASVASSQDAPSGAAGNAGRETTARAAGASTDTRSVDPAAGSTGANATSSQPVDRPAAPASNAANSAAAPAQPSSLDHARVLLLVRGADEASVAAAQSAMLSDLLDAGYDVIDGDNLQEGGAAGGGSALSALARANSAGSAVVGELTAQASPSVGKFYTGSAVLSLRVYDIESGRLVGSETVRIGAGGTPGKLGPTELAAIGDASAQAGTLGARAALRRLDPLRRQR